MKIITNNQYRQLISGYELTDKEKQDFYYLDDIDNELGFFRYKGQVYNLDMFMRNDSVKGYHAAHNLTVWSGILIALSDDNDSVKVGYYYE